MKSSARFRAFALIAAGLFGIGGYQIALRFSHPALMDRDLFRGFWTGLCIALEVIGLYLLIKKNAASAT